MSAKKTQTKRKSPNSSAKSIHRGSQPSKTLRRPTIKTIRSNPSAVIDTTTRTRAGSHPKKKKPAGKKTTATQSKSVTKYKSTPTKTTKKALEKKSSQDLAPIVKRLHPHMSKDYQKIVQKNIEKADAYQDQRKKNRKEKQKKRVRLNPTFIVVAVLAVLIGIVTYLNLPNISLQLAASEAGFSARIPGYSPAGFDRGNDLTYSRGEIILSYQPTNEANTSGYTIVERRSNWDSQSLLRNHVKPLESEYITYFDRGITVYIIDEDTATWVNGGIWYSIESDALLNSEELLKIAASL